MVQDLFILSKLIDELRSQIIGSKVNKVNQPNNYEILLTIYNKRTQKLILSTDAKLCRISLTNIDKDNPKVAFNFCMLLRKHLQGAEIKDISMQNEDRIVKLTFENTNDFLEKYTRELVIEIMGKYSNIFLLSEGKILGAIKQTPQDFEGERITLPGFLYSFPKKLNKTNIFDKSTSIDILKTFSGGELDRFILSTFSLFSPQTCQEISSTIKDTSTAEKIYDGIIDFVNKEICPIVIKNKDYDYFPFDYTHIEGKRINFSSLNDAIDYAYTNNDENKEFEQFKNQIQSKLNAYEKKQVKKLNQLEEKQRDCMDLEKLKLYGELITSNIYKIKRGMDKIVVQNYYSENYDDIEIKLEVNQTPSENAQRYYKKYNKEKRTLQNIQPQINALLEELNNISDIKYDINEAQDKEDLFDIYDELVSIGIIKEQRERKKTKEEKKFLSTTIDGFTIKVGKNSLQNDKLTFSSKKDWMWLHTKAVHSSHVIIEGENFTDEIIKRAAEICAYHSKAKNENKVEVDYTLKVNVKRQPNGKLGSVFYENYNTIIVTPKDI